MKEYILEEHIPRITMLRLPYPITAFVEFFTLRIAHSGLVNAQQQQKKNNNTLMQSQGTPGSITTTTNATNMNIVLVHGTYVDGSSWSKVVYIAAFTPEEGQSPGNFIDFTKFPKGLLVFYNGRFVYINSEMFAQAFAQGIDSAQAKVLAAAQKPFNQSILAEKSGPPARKQLPSWYQVSENDHHAIPPDAERMFAKQTNATTISLASSHASYVSHPNEIAKLILDAANTLTRGGK